MRSAATDARARTRTRPPVLVLTGIGLTAGVAQRLITELEGHFEVLTVSDPSATPPPTPMPDTAPPTPDDALAVLDAADAAEAHVVGLSFGATIAQQLAIRHPGRVRSLVLGSSSAGGELYVAPERGVRDFLDRIDELPAEEGLWASVPYLYAAATWRKQAPRIGEDVAARLSKPLDPSHYRRQHDTARAYDGAAHLADIAAPTLVMHGQQDRILPVDNGRRLAAAIAGARFMPIAGGAHAFPTDVPGTTTKLVSFLREHSRPASTRTGRVARA